LREKGSGPGAAAWLGRHVARTLRLGVSLRGASAAYTEGRVAERFKAPVLKTSNGHPLTYRDMPIHPYSLVFLIAECARYPDQSQGLPGRPVAISVAV
jgi:hypothetical protein